jgi:hypothetical protein
MNEIATFVRGTFANMTQDAITTKLAVLIYDSRNESFVDLVRESFELYNTNFEYKDFSGKPLLHFCLTNNLNTTYEYLQEYPEKIMMGYTDLTMTEMIQSPELNLILFKRQLGVVLNHKKPKMGKLLYSVLTKNKHDEPHQLYYEEPVYPDMDVPPLLKLLNREENLELDDVRFNLLKWIVCQERLENVDITKIPINYLTDILVLVVMKHHGAINTVDADLFLLSVKDVNNDFVPSDLKHLEFLIKRNVLIAKMYGQIFNRIEKCLENVGLKSMTVSFFFK